MPLFDTHVVVDWSARSTPSPPKPHKDSIWWAAADAETGKTRTPEYARTRCEAVERLAILVAGELDEGRGEVWPFQTGLRAPRTPLVFAEIYPSLLREKIRGCYRTVQGMPGCDLCNLCRSTTIGWASMAFNT